MMLFPSVALVPMEKKGLPTSGNNKDSGSFWYMLDKYGLTSKVHNGTANSLPEAADETYNIAKAPLYFVRSGHFVLYSAKLWEAGWDGSLHPSTVTDSDTDAYAIFFTPVWTYPKNSYVRYVARTLRCLSGDGTFINCLKIVIW